LERKPVVPYGFSPNSDGLNDELIIENIELYEQSNLVIFNRWGNIVYEVDKYDNNDPWTGAANKGIRLGNGILPAGVYFYILDLGDDERILEDERIRTGSIYIATGK
jgi:gliding motility-associated-like protein